MSPMQQTEWCRLQVKKHRNYQQIADQIGVSRAWIANFATNKIPNPGIVNIDKIYKYFNG